MHALSIVLDCLFFLVFGALLGRTWTSFRDHQSATGPASSSTPPPASRTAATLARGRPSADPIHHVALSAHSRIMMTPADLAAYLIAYQETAEDLELLIDSVDAYAVAVAA
jgi:hypothetical protein